MRVGGRDPQAATGGQLWRAPADSHADGNIHARAFHYAHAEPHGFAHAHRRAEPHLHTHADSLGDADALAVGGALAEDWRSRWQAVLAGADDLAADADVVAAADVIATFLWGLFVEYLNHHDATVAGRIEAFAGLVAPALCGSAPRVRAS